MSEEAVAVAGPLVAVGGLVARPALATLGASLLKAGRIDEAEQRFGRAEETLLPNVEPALAEFTIHPICAMRVHAVGAHTRIMTEIEPAPNYEIRLRGALGDALLSAFPAMRGEARAGVTVLPGGLADQAALHGVLNQIETLGLELLVVRRVS